MEPEDRRSVITSLRVYRIRIQHTEYGLAVSGQ